MAASSLTVTEVAAIWSAVAATLTFLAACLAVWAAFKAPKKAAEFAERLRVLSSLAEEKSRLRRTVLQTLLRERARISSPDSVSMLNIIDYAFHDAPIVRSAFGNFLLVADGSENHAARVQRYQDIVAAILELEGFGDKIDRSTIDRGYFPQS